MRRGEIVIVSNDAANSAAGRLGRGTVTVVPVTSSTGRVHPFQVLLPASQTGLRRDSRARAEQILSVAIDRIGKQAGQLPPALLAEVDRALRIHLTELSQSDTMTISVPSAAGMPDLGH